MIPLDLLALLFASAFVVAVQSSISDIDRISSIGRNPYHTQNGPRTLEIVNKSGKRLVVEWVHPVTGEVKTLNNGFGDGQSTVYNSFVNHTFVVHEPIEECGSIDEKGSCDVQYITVNESEEQIAQIRRGLEVIFIDKKGSKGGNFALKCREKAHKDVELGYNPEQVMIELSECLEAEGAEAIQSINEEIAFESQIRLSLSAEMENFTCSDPDRQLTEPEEIRQWTHNNVTREVFIMHDRPSSQIHVLQDFVTKEECDAITAAAAPKLHRGTVANGKGGSKLSEHRKAWQAGIAVPWDKEEEGDPIARVVRRLYGYTNDAVGYNLTVEGQEDLMSIQYFGVGKNSTEAPDQYRPHCDGACDGLPHKTGGRVATMVIYCDVPSLGGGTNFQNSNVYVKPKLHAAAFFSYMDPMTHEMETGFTSHSGCPVIEGTKRIAVHWMRVGVDKENPWDSFNTLTIKKGEEEDC